MMHEEWTVVNNINNVMVNDNRQHATSVYVRLPYMLNQCFIAHGVSSHHLTTNWSNRVFSWTFLRHYWLHLANQIAWEKKFQIANTKTRRKITDRHKIHKTTNRRRYTLVFRFIHSWEGEEGLSILFKSDSTPDFTMEAKMAAAALHDWDERFHPSTPQTQCI